MDKSEDTRSYEGKRVYIGLAISLKNNATVSRTPMTVEIRSDSSLRNVLFGGGIHSVL